MINQENKTNTISYNYIINKYDLRAQLTQCKIKQ